MASLVPTPVGCTKTILSLEEWFTALGETVVEVRPHEYFKVWPHCGLCNAPWEVKVVAVRFPHANTELGGVCEDCVEDFITHAKEVIFIND